MTQQALIDKFLGLVEGPSASPAPNQVSWANRRDDIVSQLIDQCRSNPLWTGGWRATGRLALGTVYPSQSEADYALLGQIARTAQQIGVSATEAPSVIIEAFESSGLYRPEKRGTKLAQDIPKLIDELYSRTGSVTHAQANRVGIFGRGRLTLASAPPPPRDYVIDGLLVRGKVAALAGPGGVSKTMCLMQLAASVALGNSFLGKTVGEPSMVFLGEEDAMEVERRFGAIAHHNALDPTSRSKLVRNCRAFPAVGVDARLTQPAAAGGLQVSAVGDEIIRLAKELQQETGHAVGLIGLDHAAVFHGGEFNSREDTAQTMREVQRIASEVGAAIVLVAHTSKAAAAKEEPDAFDIAGSTAWSDLARAAFVLRGMSDSEAKSFGLPPAIRGDYVSLSVVKNNYGRTGTRFWLQRVSVPTHEVSILEEVPLAAQAAVGLKKSATLGDRVVDLIRQHPGLLSRSGLRDKFAGRKGPLGVSKDKVEEALSQLLSDGRIRETTISPIERKERQLHPTVRRVLEVGD